MEEAVEEGTVFEKERPEFFIDGEDTVPVSDIDQFNKKQQEFPQPLQVVG